jgi:thiol-disulfide isomerase/thioredoxin
MFHSLIAFLSTHPWLRRLLLGGGVIATGIMLGLWQPKSSQLMPPVIFTTISGDTLNLEALRGKPVIVTFWATDCGSCVKEIPHLTELYRRYHAQGLEIIAVTMYYDLPSHVVEMTRQKQIPYPVVLDVKAEHAHSFGNVLLTPTTFLIAPDGQVVSQTIGTFKPDVLQNQIEHYL